MEAKHQIIFLGNTPFEIIGVESELREFGRPENNIKLDLMPILNEAYNFLYDKRNKTIAPPSLCLQDGYERIILPLEITALHEQATYNVIVALNDQSRREELSIYLADKYMVGYLHGKPVEFNLEGTQFTLDVNREILWENLNPENVIRLNEVPASPWGYELQYDPSTKNVVYANDPESDIPVIFLDQMVNIDPLGMALKYDISIGRLPAWDVDLDHKRILTRTCQFKDTKAALPEVKVATKDKPIRKKTSLHK